MENLTVVALIVIVFWVVILALFLTIARRQPDVRSQMQALDEKLQTAERETSKS